MTKLPDNADLQGILDTLSPEDFDGHTDFRSLTLSQRLAWCSHAARFWWEMNKNDRHNPTVRELRKMCREARAADRILRNRSGRSDTGRAAIRKPADGKTNSLGTV